MPIGRGPITCRIACKARCDGFLGPHRGTVGCNVDRLGPYRPGVGQVGSRWGQVGVGPSVPPSVGVDAANKSSTKWNWAAIAGNINCP